MVVFNAADLIGLDFETYGSVDISKHGMPRYMEDPYFTPLIGSAVIAGSSTSRYRFRFDFVNDVEAVRQLKHSIGNRMIVAHNALFEKGVLDHLGVHLPMSRFIDSAVVARIAGAAGKLEAAAPQLLGWGKHDEGGRLIKLFSVPSKEQRERGDLCFQADLVRQHPDDWKMFEEYCDIDAEAGLRIVLDNAGLLTESELRYQELTFEMNARGWKVDMDKVYEMHRRYLDNQAEALKIFREACAAPDLNLNSLPQLKRWCEDRGIKASSFAEKPVEKLIARIEKKLNSTALLDDKYLGYNEVLHLLRTKQTLGGSSLKKLDVIMRTVVDVNGQPVLKDQYLHCGAGQTLRTTGRSVQMQNLKRLGSEVANMDELGDEESVWDNGKLAENLRQVFTASHPQGRLIVGDFSAVESRGLAYLAGADWKLAAFRAKKDLYKVLASKIYNIGYDDVLKDQRQTGKVGELACGYGAGAGAVTSFAEGMGVVMTEAEAERLVNDWRAANPEVVAFWTRLDDMLHEVVEKGMSQTMLLPHDGLMLSLMVGTTPQSLLDLHPGSKSIHVTIENGKGDVILRRIFHGCYIRGRDVCYYKPSERKTGDLWRAFYQHPKTKERVWHKLYGGKLAGILTQSFCRELFFDALDQASPAFENDDDVNVVGQFHDEIVVDWSPQALPSLTSSMQRLQKAMTNPRIAPSFPLDAEIKSDYRYTK